MDLLVIQRKMKRLIEKTRCFYNEEKRLILNVGGAFIIRGLSLIVSTFSLPLYIKYFDNDIMLGVWYTFLSVLTWINMCDFGLGNGLRNKLTEALSKKNYVLVQQLITSTLWILGIIILPVAIVLGTLVGFWDVNTALNVEVEIIGADTLRHSLRILIFGVSVHFVLKIVNSILYAVQLSSINNVISLFVSMIPLVFIAFYKTSSIENNMISLSYCHCVAINLPLIVAWGILFAKKKLWYLKPKFDQVKMDIARSTLFLGLNFFGAQIFFMFLMSTNELFITKLYSPGMVVEYNVYYKLFMMIGSVFMIGITPVWSKVTKDITEKNVEKIKTVNKILYFLSFLAVLANFIVILPLQKVINIWLGENAISVDYSTALVFAFFGSVYILNIVLTTIANGLGKLKTQIWFYGIGSALKIPICLLLRKWGYEWQGIIIYNSIVLILFCAFQYFWIEKNLRDFLDKKIKENNAISKEGLSLESQYGEE